MALEEGLVLGHILEAKDAMAGLDLEHAIDQQHRIAVGQDALDPLLIVGGAWALG
jgi:hypothetical protein